MRCPVCTDTDLLMGERLSVQIDYCPNCRGIWLEKGRLDKIIEEASSKTVGYNNESRHGHHDHHDHHEHDDDDFKHGRKKKRSFFEAFDD